MKRDLDLIRAILLKIEDAPANSRHIPILIEGYEQSVILEHLELLQEHGLIEAKIHRSGLARGNRVDMALVDRLTWEGYEFLANARSDDVWTRTKKVVLEKGGSASFEIVKTLVSQLAMRHFGLQPPS